MDKVNIEAYVTSTRIRKKLLKLIVMPTCGFEKKST